VLLAGGCELQKQVGQLAAGTDMLGCSNFPATGLWQSSQRLRMAAGPGNFRFFCPWW